MYMYVCTCAFVCTFHSIIIVSIYTYKYADIQPVVTLNGSASFTNTTCQSLLHPQKTNMEPENTVLKNNQKGLLLSLGPQFSGEAAVSFPG